MTDSSVESVVSVASDRTLYDNVTDNVTLHLSHNSPRKYIYYTNYTPWPTMCDVALKMTTMVRCEHTAAASRGWSNFDWAEHCLKQALRIAEQERCATYVLRRWQWVG